MFKLFFGIMALAMAVLLSSAFLGGDGDGPLDLLQSAWGRLTVLDAYFAILTVYLLTAFRERSGWLRLLWLLLYLTLGSLAIALYMLLRFPSKSEARVVE